MEVGFEPTEGLPPHTLSRRAPSATRRLHRRRAYPSSAGPGGLVSLLPPVHIAIIRSSDIHPTIGDALAALHGANDLSRAITFITGPSRTADIELTLTVGVHGPKELYVIIIEES